MRSTKVYLTVDQTEGLASRARERNTTVAVEIRAAIDAYLADTSPLELELVDATTLRVKADIDAMLKTTEQMLADHRRFLREIRKLRASGEAGRTRA